MQGPACACRHPARRREWRQPLASEPPVTVHATADASPLLRSDAGGIVTLTLNRPAARNALSEALIEALTRELDRIAADPCAS